MTLQYRPTLARCLVTVCLLQILVNMFPKATVRHRVVPPTVVVPYLGTSTRMRIVPRSAPATAPLRSRIWPSSEVQAQKHVQTVSQTRGVSKQQSIQEVVESKEGQNLLALIGGEKSGDAVVESSSDSEDCDVVDAAMKAPGATRERLSQARGKRRLRKALTMMAEMTPKLRKVWDQVPSYLELASLSRSSLLQYIRSLGILSELAITSTTDPNIVDADLSAWMNKNFLQGGKPWNGEKAMAAVLAFSPSLCARGTNPLPRCWRTLKGWRKLNPGRSKLNRGHAVWCAIAMKFVRRNRWRVGVMEVLRLYLYLRVSEAFQVRFSDFLAPTVQGLQSWCVKLHPVERGIPSKTGMVDENLALSTPLARTLDPLWKALSKKASTETIMDCSYLDYLREFKQITHELGIEDVVPSESRHSGASIDVARCYRTAVEAQKQGRWQQPKSVKRYEKAGELNRSWACLSEAQRRHFEACEVGIVDTLLRNQLPPDFVHRAKVELGRSKRPSAFCAAAGMGGAAFKASRTSS